MTTGNQASRLTPARFGLYVKIVVVVIIALYLLSFALKNSDNPTPVWLFFGLEPKLNVLWVVLLTAALTLLLRYFVKLAIISVRRSRGNRQ